MKKKTLTCICCPLGCKIIVEKKDEAFVFQGNECKKGETYACQEITNPQRIVTTTIPIQHSYYPLLPVHSNRGVPKDLVKDCVRFLSSITCTAPVIQGDVIHRNILDTGVDIIASCSMRRINDSYYSKK